VITYLKEVPADPTAALAALAGFAGTLSFRRGRGRGQDVESYREIG